jgi:hypothetical protein
LRYPGDEEEGCQTDAETEVAPDLPHVGAAPFVLDVSTRAADKMADHPDEDGGRNDERETFHAILPLVAVQLTLP